MLWEVECSIYSLLPLLRVKQVVVTGKIRRERKTKVQRIKLEWRWAAGRFGQVQTVMPFFYIYIHIIFIIIKAM